MQAGQGIDRYLATMRAGSWFQALPDGLRAQLERLALVRRMDAGSLLFARGDAPDGLYCVVEGAVRVAGISESGKEAVLAIVEAPHWFGEIALFDGQARTHDAWAEGTTVLLHIPQQPLLAALRDNPAWWREFGLLLTQKLRTTFLVLEDWALLPAAGRLARRLVSIAEGYGEWKDRSRRLLYVSQEQLALMLSLSRQSVNQILKQWESRGLVRLSRGGIELLDIDGLRALAAS
ncbi:Crp/Fnr family transcriptional regulator [Noviherbaspirillum aridicola]|uniref:Transcriptional regulator n=1 Tax=Noviherbaspirillum aridicola TaxID=2849687 RepID=A0ABQ4PZI7_9BURK|nr:Crp/Fnr family transcriptional regulator [Noviherbaspirillum aridicola]GIZ50240.1 transcriptional regulator [Noviherbaspirillum aridicola]